MPGPPGCQDAADDVVDMDKVAHLGAIAVDLNTLAVARRPQQPWHEIVFGLHAGSVNVGEAERRAGYAITGGVGGQEHLAGRLGRAIRRERAQWRLLGNYDPADVSGHDVGGAEQEATYLALACEFKQGCGHLDVQLIGPDRILD